MARPPMVASQAVMQTSAAMLPNAGPMVCSHILIHGESVLYI